MPKYRVPVFAELARRPGIDLKVYYTNDEPVPNVKAEGFEAIEIRSTHLWKRFGLMWQSMHLTTASRKHCDVLIMPWMSKYVDLFPTLLKARMAGVGSVIWGHGYSKRPRRVKTWIRELPTGFADATLFYSHDVAAKFKARKREDLPVFVAPNALDQSGIQAARQAWIDDPARLQAFRREQGLVEVSTILFVSRLDPANRVDLLIQAVAELRREIPALRLNIVGKGQDEDRLRTLVNDLGIVDNVRFLGAIYDEMVLAPWFLTADAFCYPRNMGLTILHAFGYGVPVIAGDNRDAHNPEVAALRPGINGLSFKDLDVESLVATLRHVLTNRTLREQLALGAHRTVMNDYSLRAMVDGIEAAARHAARARGRV